MEAFEFYEVLFISSLIPEQTESYSETPFLYLYVGGTLCFLLALLAFQVSHWGLWSISNWFLCRVIDTCLMHSLPCGHPVFLASLIKDIIFPLACTFGIFVKQKTYVIRCIWIWVLYSVPLVYVFLWQHQAAFITLALQYNLKSSVGIPLALFFLFRTALALCSLFYDHVNLEFFFLFLWRIWNFYWYCTESVIF